MPDHPRHGWVFYDDGEQVFEVTDIRMQSGDPAWLESPPHYFHASHWRATRAEALAALADWHRPREERLRREALDLLAQADRHAAILGALDAAFGQPPALGGDRAMS